MSIDPSGELLRPQINFIQHIDQLTTKTNVVLHCRSSREQQKYKGNLDDQVKSCTDEIVRRKLPIYFTQAVVCSGWKPEEYIPSIVQKAKECNGVIVAETIDRLMRPMDYHSVTNPEAFLNDWMLGKLEKLLDGVPTFTLQNPNATPGENRSQQTKRGQKEKGNKGGRPMRRDNFRKVWIPWILDLHESGLSIREIQKQLEFMSQELIPIPTIHRWLKKKK